MSIIIEVYDACEDIVCRLPTAEGMLRQVLNTVDQVPLKALSG